MSGKRGLTVEINNQDNYYDLPQPLPGVIFPDHFSQVTTQAQSKGYEIQLMYEITCCARHHDPLNSLDGTAVVFGTWKMDH